MKKIQQSITINVPREVVWAAIINDKKFRLWCVAFEPGSHFVGGWQQGQSIRFLMKDGQGQLHGMQSEIAVSEHLRRITLHNVGVVNGDVVDFDSDEAKKWINTYEMYELEQISPQSTRFSVNVETHEDYFDDMSGAWSQALLNLKEVCENNQAPFVSITVTTDVQVPVEKAWMCWTSTEYVEKWNHASADWYCPAAGNDLRVGGRFIYTMASLDGRVSFDFAGTYTDVVHGDRITSQLDDGRRVWVTFEAAGPESTRVVEVFEAEYVNSLDLQRDGWQAILDNFRRVVEEDLSR